MSSDSDMEHDGADSGCLLVYNTMFREDITAQLREICGSACSSRRAGELHDVCQMLHQQHDVETQQASLQTLRDGKVTLTSSQCLPSSAARLLWPCGSCGDSGHSAKYCPAISSAAVAMPGSGQAEGPADSISTRVTGGKKARKRAKKAAKAAEAEKIAAGTNDSVSKSGHGLGAAAVASLAARTDAAATQTSQHHARASSKALATAPQPAAQPVPADQPQTEDSGAGAGDDDLTSLVSAFAPLSRRKDVVHTKTDPDELVGRPHDRQPQQRKPPPHQHQQSSALGHVPLQESAQPDERAGDAISRYSLVGGGTPGSAQALPAGHGLASAGISLPSGLQQLQHNALPRKVAAGPEEEEDDSSDPLGKPNADAPAVQPTGWPGDGQHSSFVPCAPSHPLQHPSQLTPAQERQEQEELDAALKASMKDMCGSGARPVAGAGAGLANDAGEYNCFLNAIIQCVWRCRDFKDGIVQLDPDELPNDEGSPRIVRELVQLFKALDEQQRASTDADVQRAVISPIGLREALSHTDFKLGEMNDAAEVLRMMYDALIDQGHRDMVTSCFGLDIHESVRCRHCNRETHVIRYTQYFQQVPAAALRTVAEQDPDNALGYYLAAIDKQTRKTCDLDMGGCGRPNQVGHRAQGLAPSVSSIEVAWQKNQETAEDIAETLHVVDLFLDPSQRYQALQPKRQRLVAMVCYYGQHYMAFVLVKLCGTASGPGHWSLLDDANAIEVGDWDAVLHKCKVGRIQPSLLLYEDIEE